MGQELSQRRFRHSRANYLLSSRPCWMVLGQGERSIPNFPSLARSLVSVLVLPSPPVSWTFHLIMFHSVALHFALCVLVLPFPSVNPSAPSERFVSVLASAQWDWKMMMVTVPAASPLLAVGVPRSFLRLIQLLLGQLSNSRSLSHQPMFFMIVPDMLPCEISIQHSRCIQVLLQSSSRF